MVAVEATKMLPFCAVVLTVLFVDVQAQPQLLVPLPLDSNGDAAGYTRRAKVDDEAAEVSFTQDFPFGDKAFKKFYVSYFFSFFLKGYKTTIVSLTGEKILRKEIIEKALRPYRTSVFANLQGTPVN